MAKQSAFTTVTLRRLPQGESLQITISGNKSQTILRDKDTGTETPTISETDPYKLTPAVYGTKGTAAALSNVAWTMDGQSVGSVGIGASIDAATGALSFTSSPIGKGKDTTIHGIVFAFSATATLNGHTYNVSKQIVINCAEASANSYWGAITAENGTTLDDETDESGNYLHHSTKLVPTLYLGTAKQTPTAVKWFKTGAGDEGKDLEITASESGKWELDTTNHTLTVYQGGVDAAAHFEAHFYVGGTAESNKVEAEGVSIVDVTDDLQLDQIPDQYVDSDGVASFTVKAYSNNTGKQIKLSNSTSKLIVVLTDSIRQRTILNDYLEEMSINDNTGLGTVKMSENYLHVPYAGSDGKQIAGEWCICGDDETKDTMTTDVTKATECEVILLIGAEVELS